LQSHLQQFAITPEFLHACLVRLGELGCFNAGEIVKGEIPKRQLQPQSQPQETEAQWRQRLESGFEKVSAESREGRAACMKIISATYGREVANIFHLWNEQMERDYHVSVLTEKITRFAGDWFLRWNKNPLNPKHYDELRCVLSKLHMLGSLDCRTRDEKLRDALETADLHDRDVRQEIARVTHQIHSEGLGHKGGMTL
jgi:hypothetical protein